MSKSDLLFAYLDESEVIEIKYSLLALYDYEFTLILNQTLTKYPCIGLRPVLTQCLSNTFDFLRCHLAARSKLITGRISLP